MRKWVLGGVKSQGPLDSITYPISVGVLEGRGSGDPIGLGPEDKWIVWDNLDGSGPRQLGRAIGPYGHLNACGFEYLVHGDG